MIRILAVVTFLLLFVTAGCTWGDPANGASQPIEVNPSAWGTGQQVIAPAEGSGFIDGEPLDARRH